MLIQQYWSKKQKLERNSIRAPSGKQLSNKLSEKLIGFAASSDCFNHNKLIREICSAFGEINESFLGSQRKIFLAIFMFFRTKGVYAY